MARAFFRKRRSPAGIARRRDQGSRSRIAKLHFLRVCCSIAAPYHLPLHLSPSDGLHIEVGLAPPIQQLLHTVDMLCIDYYEEARQRKDRSGFAFRPVVWGFGFGFRLSPHVRRSPHRALGAPSPSPRRTAHLLAPSLCPMPRPISHPPLSSPSHSSPPTPTQHNHPHLTTPLRNFPGWPWDPAY
jgi:hypothetical protein